MSEIGEAFRDLKEHKRQEREKAEPHMVKKAREKLQKYGLLYVYSQSINIVTDAGTFVYWPWKRWYNGLKPLGHIKGRGLNKLIKELETLCAKQR